jgi:hypothetical protein
MKEIDIQKIIMQFDLDDDRLHLIITLNLLRVFPTYIYG